MAEWLDDFKKSKEFENIIQQRQAIKKEERESATSFDILKSQADPLIRGTATLVEAAYNAISGRNRTEFQDLPEIMNSNAAPDSIPGSANIIFSQFYNSNSAGTLDIIKQADPKAEFSKDKFNNIIVFYSSV